MHGVTQGLLNKQIAGDLRISEVTVKLHRANTMRKMSAATNADLIRAGQELSLT
ncbi:Response regulator protein TmoT [compost metagenome]